MGPGLRVVLRAKEQAGRERAYLATAFDANALNGQLLKRASRGTREGSAMRLMP
jgi:hypothetical protein